MKKTAMLVTAAFLISLSSFSQKAGSDVVTKMNELLLSNNISNTFYNTAIKAIEQNEYVFPVNGNVILERGTNKNRGIVKFYYQNGTGITKKNDSSYKRAFGEIYFKRKKDAGSFIELFKQIHN